MAKYWDIPSNIDIPAWGSIRRNISDTSFESVTVFDKTTDDTDDITVWATNKFATAGEKTKLGFITVTQAVDLDTIESDTATNNAKVSNATHTGDATGATALTLATVNANVGSFGIAGSVAQFVVNAKGLITSAVNVAISITASQVSDFTASVNALITGKVNTTTTISTTSPLVGGGDLSANRTLTTSMATNKLIWRGTAGVGVMEEITLGTNLSLTGTTLNATGGGWSLTLTETEIDFWSTLPLRSKRFTITDAGITNTSKIIVSPSWNVATGRVGNDWEWDSIAFSAKAGTGNFILTALSSWRIKGKRKIFYTFT